ncbi:hypothetical protein KIL84_001052 [Mauremys mutica]|uniref:Uncharacterized protein n=1 Tax=Mauremys mutica TaxID=74926 RepID=A0A9D4ANY6_9SAUR|nr:hypothetical protein KIL84_001052 [Mauremys mutica]
MKRCYTVAAMSPEETNTTLWQIVFETGHGSGETGIANGEATAAERWFFRGLGGSGHRQLQRAKRIEPDLFLPDPRPDALQNAETEGDAYSIGPCYLKLKEKFGIKPVRVHNRKTAMRAMV